MTMMCQTTAETNLRRPAGLRGALTAALLAAMLGLTGCSTVSNMMPDMSWANPMTWFEDDEPSTVQNAPRPAGTASDERFPNLGRVPPRPVEQSSTAERRQAMGTLAADRANARYTDEELRARPATGNQVPPSPSQPMTQLPGYPAGRAPSQLQGGAVPAQQMQQLAAAQNDPIGQRAVGGVPQPMPQTRGQVPQGYQQQVYQPAPAYQPPAYQQPYAAQNQAANMGAVYAANLQASAATTLPQGMAQVQPQGGQALAAGPAPAPLTPGVNAPQSYAAPAIGLPSRQLLAVVRFSNGSATLDARDRNLLKDVAEYQKGTGGKGRLRVIGISAASGEAADVAGKRAQSVAAELQKHRVDTRLMMLEARAEGATAYYQAANATADQSRRVEIYLEN